MKNRIIYIFIFLFLAVTFVTDNPPPGWYQQTLPVNDVINDIFFIDSLTGWAVTAGGSTSSDTGYIMKTTNGGTNWNIQYDSIMDFRAVQFLNLNTGYVAGGVYPGKVYKTTNSGSNWINISSFASQFYDLFFVNTNTGWVTDANGSFGGLFKTTNGGINWTQQLSGSFFIRKLFFINSDTGWAGSNEANGKLYRTTNGGINWNLQYTSNIAVVSIFFLNGQKGWMRGGTGNGVIYTTDGGFNWYNAQGNTAAGFDLRFVNDSIGYSGMQSYRIPKSTDGGKTWGYQISPIQNNMSIYMFSNDTFKGWAGGTGVVKTDDGGGPITYNGIKSSSTFVTPFDLKQNYPNPFNPTTKIMFDVKKNSRISLKIYTIDGREVDELLDYEKFDGGNSYYVDFDAHNLSSGVYLYQMTGWTDDKKEIFIDTKKMVLIK